MNGNNKQLNDVETRRNGLVQRLSEVDVGSKEYEKIQQQIAEIDEVLDVVYTAMMDANA